MSRLIDGEKLKDIFDSLSYDDWNQGVSTSWADAYKEVSSMVEDQPTIEAVPVVQDDDGTLHVTVNDLTKIGRVLVEENAIGGGVLYYSDYNTVTYDRILWENDIMRQQLEKIGKTIGADMDDVVPVVHGRWIPWKKWNEDFVVCSECKLIGYKNYDALRPGYASNMNYCPNCGAHMKGEQDDND